jgi:phasin family protein
VRLAVGFAEVDLKRDNEREEFMTNEAAFYVDMLRKFGGDLSLPKLDIDKLIEGQKKNVEALSQSATVAAKGAQTVAKKQRQIFEAGLQEATILASRFHPLGNLQDNLALQAEFANKVFEITVKAAQDNATTVEKSTGEAVKILQDRLKESLEEMSG